MRKQHSVQCDSINLYFISDKKLLIIIFYIIFLEFGMKTMKVSRFNLTVITRDRNLCDFYPCLYDLCNEFAN